MVTVNPYFLVLHYLPFSLGHGPLSAARQQRQVVREDSRSDVALIPRPAFAQAAPQSVHALEHRNRSLDPSAKRLRQAEQHGMLALLFGWIAHSLLGNRRHLHPRFARGVGHARRMEALVRAQQLWRASENLHVVFDRRLDATRFVRTFGVDVVVRDQTAFDLMQFQHVAEFHFLARLAALEQFGVRLEDAQHFLLVGHRPLVLRALAALMDPPRPAG